MFTWTTPESYWDQFWEDGTSKVEISGVPDYFRLVDGFTSHSTCGRHGGTFLNFLPRVSLLDQDGKNISNGRCQCRRYLVLTLSKEMEEFLLEEGLNPENNFNSTKPIWYTTRGKGGKVYKIFFDPREMNQEIKKHQYLKERDITTGEFEGKTFEEG